QRRHRIRQDQGFIARIFRGNLSQFSLLAALWVAQMVSAVPADGQSTNSYPARGVVEKIAPDLSTITIHHQAIPGYMMEMTMDFPVKNTNELAHISPHDQVTFTLVVTKDTEWIQNIHHVGPMSGNMTNNPPMKMNMPGATTNSPPMQMNMSEEMMLTGIKPGDPLPDYQLTTTDGNLIHLSDFRGKALAFTFFFTRCPLPDYCPRMNNNFGETRKLLTADPHAPANWELLSISFDPGFDTPEVLTAYAGAFRGEDTNRWIFASAPTNVLIDAALRFGLIIMRQGDSISHNMRTVVLDSKGDFYKQFNGNTWTPEQLAGAITQAASL
ncbi:MAG: SCO family protein, partial [Limisphaerales bacterium]